MSNAKEMTSQNPLWATGRRKTSIARVRTVPGEGRVFVNSKSLEDFFAGHDRQKVTSLAPLRIAPSLAKKADFFITTQGGGVSGQADSIRLGLARALVDMDPQLRQALRKDGHLTRDPRMVERKKYGRPKARRRFQHSKR